MFNDYVWKNYLDGKGKDVVSSFEKNYTGEFTKEYVVTENNIIKDTDWTYLEETGENTITLITCIENEPEYRRCVRGIEK